ncbi:hypothetical protein RhoFasB10_03493 [Rhodococcus sp. B10]|nr:hypothetical protein [Rhodococcus sp. B10]
MEQWSSTKSLRVVASGTWWTSTDALYGSNMQGWGILNRLSDVLAECGLCPLSDYAGNCHSAVVSPRSSSIGPRACACRRRLCGANADRTTNDGVSRTAATSTPGSHASRGLRARTRFESPGLPQHPTKLRTTPAVFGEAGAASTQHPAGQHLHTDSRGHHRAFSYTGNGGHSGEQCKHPEAVEYHRHQWYVEQNRLGPSTIFRLSRGATAWAVRSAATRAAASNRVGTPSRVECGWRKAEKNGRSGFPAA